MSMRHHRERAMRADTRLAFLSVLCIAAALGALGCSRPLTTSSPAGAKKSEPAVEDRAAAAVTLASPGVSVRYLGKIRDDDGSVGESVFFASSTSSGYKMAETLARLTSELDGSLSTTSTTQINLVGARGGPSVWVQVVAGAADSFEQPSDYFTLFQDADAYEWSDYAAWRSIIRTSKTDDPELPSARQLPQSQWDRDALAQLAADSCAGVADLRSEVELRGDGNAQAATLTFNIPFSEDATSDIVALGLDTVPRIATDPDYAKVTLKLVQLEDQPVVLVLSDRLLRTTDWEQLRRLGTEHAADYLEAKGALRSE